jgi:hypothetical protein
MMTDMEFKINLGKYLEDQTNNKLQEIIEFIEKNNQYYKSFSQCLGQLNSICKNNPGYTCYLYPDWAEYSLSFNIAADQGGYSLLHGGLIFHGNPDRSLSVQLEPRMGFQIHT